MPALGCAPPLPGAARFPGDGFRAIRQLHLSNLSLSRKITSWKVWSFVHLLLPAPECFSTLSRVAVASSEAFISNRRAVSHEVKPCMFYIRLYVLTFPRDKSPEVIFFSTIHFSSTLSYYKYLLKKLGAMEPLQFPSFLKR